MTNTKTLNKAAGIAAALITLAAPGLALAAGTGMPWESPIDDVLQSLTGPVVKAMGIIAIVGFGIAFAYSEGGSASKKGLGILMGIAIAFSATTFGLTFFGYSGGAGF